MNKPKVNKEKMKELKDLADNKRLWHPNFIKYTEFIVSHPHYKGLFFERGSDGRVKWVIAGKSEKGQERRMWWDDQCTKNGIKIEAGCYAKVALKIHPTKKHTCQICGKELSLEYVYPNRRTILAIKKEFTVNISPFSKGILELIEELVTVPNDIEKFKRIFKIKAAAQFTKNGIKDYIKNTFVDAGAKGLLSPGAMSNSPDRFDGYHSDGACCRHESDKGRHKTNLQRYGQDRRVYENWADGDWKQADRLMSLFRKHGTSADHIGPISLGFCHRPRFQPMTIEQQSAKNNRMSLSDVKILLDEEAKNDVVISWHSKFIWDKLKLKVETDNDAKKISDLMRKNMHYILIVFSMIDERGYGKFLEQFLNPEFSFFDYTFEGFNPETGLFTKVLPKELKGKNQQNNVIRYYRVAFEKLQEYKGIENRKTNKWKSKDVDDELEPLFSLLKANKDNEAKMQLNKIFSLLANLAESNW
jgi:Alw26I/Eco31I/Esp3I family type II restriction endonuclease